MLDAGGVNRGLANWAHHFNASYASAKLKDRFYAVLVASCTYAMPRLTALHVWLDNVQKSRIAAIFKLVALLLSFPVFNLKYFLFKVAFGINQRRMLDLHYHQVLLYAEQGIEQTASSALYLRHSMQAINALNHVGNSLDRVHKAVNRSGVSHVDLRG